MKQRKNASIGTNENLKVMREMKKNGASLETIGKHFGITRERIRQLLVKHYGTTFKRAKRAKTAKTVKVECNYCGKAIKIPVRKLLHSKTNKFYCSGKCFREENHVDPKETLERKRKYAREYYRVYNKLPHRKEKNEKYFKEYYKRPEVKERLRKYRYDRYHADKEYRSRILSNNEKSRQKRWKKTTSIESQSGEGQWKWLRWLKAQMKR